MGSLKQLYYEAKENPRLRRTFLAQVDLQERGPYVRKVVYGLPQTYRTDECTPMAVDPHPFSEENCPGYQAKIIVHPLAFYEDYIVTLDDFLSILIDHEGFHAREYFLTPQKISLNAFCLEEGRALMSVDRHYWRDVFENRAYHNQLEQHRIGRRKLSSAMIDSIHENMGS